MPLMIRESRVTHSKVTSLTRSFSHLYALILDLYIYFENVSFLIAKKQTMYELKLLSVDT